MEIPTVVPTIPLARCASALLLAALAALTGCGDGAPAGTAPHGEHRPLVATQGIDGDAGTGTGSGSGTTASPIAYHGGAVMTGQVRVYLVYYGDFGSAARSVVEDFVGHVGASAYFAINATYTDAKGHHPGSDVVLAGTAHDAYSLGKALSPARVAAVVTSAITRGALPRDENGVYFVLSAKDVTQAGFGTKFCGYHSYVPVGAAIVKYAWVGDASTQAARGCGVHDVSPNGSPGADAMISVLAHELDESVTDPFLDAWFDAGGEENADKCAWRFGATHATASGALANLRLGTREYLVQENWVVDAAGGHCAMAVK